MVFILQILKTILRGNTLCKFCSNYVLEVFGDFLIIKVTVASFKLKLENRKSDHSGVIVGVLISKIPDWPEFSKCGGSKVFCHQNLAMDLPKYKTCNSDLRTSRFSKSTGEGLRTTLFFTLLFQTKLFLIPL